MRSPNRVDTSTLDWVKSEIDQTLEQAREALQRYDDAGDDLTPLRSFSNNVHQVAGTLQMVELGGAAQLAQEVESLASAVIAGKVDRTAGPTGLLDEGLSHLSGYMERLAKGLPDRPIDNVDVINELRRARHAESLDGYSMFHPELHVYPARPQPVEELEGEEYFQRIREQRRRFQGALLRWLREQDDEDAWRDLAEVVTGLYELSRFQVSMQIWWVARAYLDVLKAAELSRDDPRKHPLAKLDQLMRTLAEEGEAAIAREGSEKLVRYMLYQIGTGEVNTEPIREVIELFELDTMLGARSPQAPLPESSALAAMKARAADPLRAVQAALDNSARTGVAGDDFAASDQHLREIADAARELGIDELANVCSGIRQALFIDGEPNHSEDVLVAAARALLFIEHALDAPEEITEDWQQEAAAMMDRLSLYNKSSQTPSMAIESHEIDTESLEKHELRRLVTAVAGQIEENLKQAEQNLEHFARDASDTNSMTAVVDSLQQVHGAVRMLGQHKLCDLLEMAIDRIRELISGEAFPSDPLLDALAVTIGTTDTFVKGLERDAPNLDELLHRAEWELEAAVSAGKPVAIDPASTLKLIEESFDVWMKENSDYEAFNSLRRSLRDIGALAHQQEQFNLQGIAQEMINLVDIVMDDPGALTGEVEDTLRRSLSTLTELTASLESPAGTVTPLHIEQPPQPPGTTETDDIVRETFADEARECLRNIDAYLDTLGNEPGNDAALTDMRRAFHTIKGSGRMVRARGVAELAWVVEDVLNRCMTNDVAMSKPVLQFIAEARGELAGLLEQGLDSSTDLQSWRERAASLQQSGAGDEPVAAHAQAEGAEESPFIEGDTTPARTGFRDEVRDSAGPEDDSTVDPGEPALQSIEELGEQGHDLDGGRDSPEGMTPFSDNEVIRIFSKEALSHIAAIRAVIDECGRHGEAAISKELLRAVHTIQGNARALHLVEMSEAYTVLDNALSDKVSKNAKLYEKEVEVLDALLISTAKVLDHLNRDKRFPEVVRQELVEIAGRLETAWKDPVNKKIIDESPLEDLELVSDFTTDSFGDDSQPPDDAAELPGDGEESSVIGSVFEELVDPDQGGHRGAPPGAPETGVAADAAVEQAMGDVLADIDLRDVFMEEAADTLSRIDWALQQARRSGLDADSTNALKRELHTLKGSSRAAGVEGIGDLSHDAETMLENVSAAGDPPPDLLETLEEVHDTLANMVQGLEDGRPAEAEPWLVERLRGGALAAAPVPDYRGGDPAPPLIPEEGGMETGADALQARHPEKPPAPAAVPDQAATNAAEAPARTDSPRPGGGRSTVRIHSNVLDKLVNYAGEVSISRAQMEEQLSGLKGNLNELRGNVARFADQVRELDIQADTQIRSRVAEEKVSDAGHDFDPLEMDRYSRLQQLSRSLSESVDDLVTIQSGLNRFAVQTEGVLSQQAMLNTELQDGLMSARMVPFNTLVPRLRHQARQTARELGKNIDFTVTGGELEVDRNILDQLSEALEHMIRNSLDHGIEAEDARATAGKPARGSVRIECRQEGNEVVLKFSDDGAGLDVGKIKSRAVEAGLLAADSELTDDEVIQLVVLSGFSTAAAVTQLSGRGVGLDVVNDAVRRLGGTLSMENRPGEGVSFEMRLPLSLSITQAMFVRCGDQRFAVPLGVIETVLKTEPENLSEMSKDGDPLFRRDDRLYTLMDLTATLGLEPASSSPRIPVLLVRMGAREVAVRVDDLIGTDEIVVKQLGDHLGRMSGINGATVTGDGSVVLILDVAELWLAQERLPAFKHELPRGPDTQPRVMVVDDSLTVRKVTGRNLGRHGMEVTMARDGFDALDQLAKVRPDVMLVDIEMPRMDGYELTTRIREDANYRDIPIIVITSRAGARHHERAMELGANAYLTKPYQERELLAEVNALLNRAPPAVH